MMIHNLPASFSIAGLKARFLTADDRLAIFGLLQACDDFSIFSSGKPSTEEDALGLLHDRPPGVEPSQKAVIGFFDENGNLICALDFVIGYPQENIWFIGLLLVHPDRRNEGIGRQIVALFSEWAKEQFVDSLMIGVLEGNTNALRFWQSNGFEEFVRTGPRTFGLKEHMVIRMKKILNFDS